jgi:gliding motility-associated-like protein
VCFEETTELDATANVDSYLWSTGETTPTITIDQGGTYIVEVFTDNCTGSDTVLVLEGQHYDLDYAIDACPNASVALTIPFSGTAYQWETGGTGQTEIVTGPGHYVFIVWDDLGCAHQDTITIIPLDAGATIYSPNAFTPDGDGINDQFIMQGFGEEEVKIEIFDRWGERLYETNSMYEPWDGKYQGILVKPDVYVYRLEYNAHCAPNEKTTVFGHVTVVR